MMEKLKSRKLIVSLIVAVLVVLNDHFETGISEAAIYKLVALVMAYVIGQGIADHGSQGKKPDIVIAKGEEEGPNWDDTAKPDEEDKK